MENIRNVANIEFPKYSGININMLPYIMGMAESIPIEYRDYLPIIEACNLPKSEIGKVGFLTITESVVEAGKSQRRGGIHTEKHPSRNWGGGGWGGREGGLYMASNVSDSCMVWDKYIDNPGPGGDCQHLENELGRAIVLESGELVWITDGTPHESLPLEIGTRRQFFRLVTSNVSVWYSQNSTENRLGVLPNCKIIDTNKFK